MGADLGQVIAPPHTRGRRLYARLLPDGRRLHLNDGPIDLVIAADGEPAAVAAAYGAAIAAFDGLLDALCCELPALRQAADPARNAFTHPVARTMHAAVAPFAATRFITPMAAVAGAVAQYILAAMTNAAPLARSSVNDGGDIALFLAAGQSTSIGLIDRPDRPSLFARSVITHRDAVRGVATSGWRGRSFSLGIADAVTVLAATAAAADAAATVIANAVDLPGHASITRLPARQLQPDNDLGDRRVTRGVGPLEAGEVDQALAAGLAVAAGLVAARLIIAAALHLQGETRTIGDMLLTPNRALTIHA